MTTEQLLDLLEDDRVYEGGLLAGVNLVLVAYLPEVNDIGQQAVEVGARERLAAPQGAFACLPLLVDPAAPLQLLDHRQQRLVLEVQGEDRPDALGLGLVDGQPETAGSTS